MKLLITGTAINLLFNLLLFAWEKKLYSQAVNLGWQQADFQAEQIQVQGRRRRRTMPYLYGVRICFRGGCYFFRVTKEEYEALLGRQRRLFYVREFPNRLLNPDFEKYEFSLQETDWSRGDNRRCRKGFLTVFLSLEVILSLIAAGI